MWKKLNNWMPRTHEWMLLGCLVVAFGFFGIIERSMGISIISIPFTFLMSFFCVLLLRGYETQLQQRMASADSKVISIVLNGSVPLGRIADADIAKLEFVAMKDPNNYLRQMLNLGKVAGLALGTIIKLFPQICFGIAVMLAMCYPNQAWDLFLKMRASSSGEVTNAIRQIADGIRELLGVFILLLVALSVATGRFGFVNCFRQSVEKALLQKIQSENAATMPLVTA
jgi:hypothetical protein